MRLRYQLRPTLSRNNLAVSLIAAGVIAGGVLLAAAPHSVHASSKQAQTAGAMVFRDKGCQHCHGDDATGTDRGPDLSVIGKKWHRDHIEQQIREGGGGMPAFGDVLQHDEIKSLVDYLSAKRKPAKKVPRPGAAPPDSRPKPPSKAPEDDSGV